MNNKYISSFVLVLVSVSLFLYWSNTNNIKENSIEVTTTAVEETSTTVSYTHLTLPTILLV